jgi:hypothetical protein
MGTLASNFFEKQRWLRTAIGIRRDVAGAILLVAACSPSMLNSAVFSGAN